MFDFRSPKTKIHHFNTKKELISKVKHVTLLYQNRVVLLYRIEVQRFCIVIQRNNQIRVLGINVAQLGNVTA